MNEEIRLHRTDWLIIQARDLVKQGLANRIPSLLFYACFEARLALERYDLDIVLASVAPEERPEILDGCKPKNGIEKLGRKVGALKERYQIFIISVFEALDMKSNYYDFKKSRSLQNELSSYIHSYWIVDNPITIESEESKRIPLLVEKVEKFIRKSSYVEGEGHGIRSLELKSMPDDDKVLLDQWKDDRKMTEKELILRLKENARRRRRENQ